MSKIILNRVSFLLLFFGSLIFAQDKYVEKISGIDHEVHMQLIQKGSFIMGSTKSEKGHFGDEGPQHKVNIDGFWMSQHEITWDLYNYFVTREMDANQILQFGAWRIIIKSGLEKKVAKLANCGLWIPNFEILAMADVGSGFLDRCDRKS